MTLSNLFSKNNYVNQYVLTECSKLRLVRKRSPPKKQAKEGKNNVD